LPPEAMGIYTTFQPLTNLLVASGLVSENCVDTHALMAVVQLEHLRLTHCHRGQVESSHRPSHI